MFLQVKFEFSLSYKVHDIVMTNYEVKDAKGRNHYPLNKKNQFSNLPWVTSSIISADNISQSAQSGFL